MPTNEADVVRAWHRALNEGEIERLVTLSDDDIEVGGPRGSGHGTQLLREWFGRAGIRLTPQRIFHQGSMVVVEQVAEWHSEDSGEVISHERVASVFAVQEGRVASVIRHPDLASALAAANLDEIDRV